MPVMRPIPPDGRDPDPAAGPPPSNYLRDASATIFLTAWVPLFASFAALLVYHQQEGAARVFCLMMTVVASDVLCGPIEAALANGVLAHADETDDSHAPSLSHPGCAVVPAALAVGEWLGIDGMRFLRAVSITAIIVLLASAPLLLTGPSRPRSGGLTAYAAALVGGPLGERAVLASNQNEANQNNANNNGNNNGNDNGNDNGGNSNSNSNGNGNGNSNGNDNGGSSPPPPPPPRVPDVAAPPGAPAPGY